MTTQFGPKEIKINNILANSLGSFIAGIIGSTILFILVFFVSSFIDVTGSFSNQKIGGTTNSIFPLVLSIIAFIACIITTILTYQFLNKTESTKYKKSYVHLGQIAFFSLLTYIFFAPVYIILGTISYDYIMLIFIAHILFLSFGMNLILELLNNYRYILTGLYGSFIALFLSSIGAIIIYNSFSSGFAKLLILLVLLPLINTLNIFIKEIFEMLYFQYFKMTGFDQLGDIFQKIEDEENELMKQEEEENNF